MAKTKKARKIQAIPPNDYKGTQADWLVNLQSMGLWNGMGWHGDVMITEKQWWTLLEMCEGNEDAEQEERYICNWYILLSPRKAEELMENKTCIYAGPSKLIPQDIRDILGIKKKRFGTYKAYVSIYKVN